MRVLHLIDSGGLYGAERMLLSLVQEQLKQGLEPMILSAGEPGIEEKPIEAEAKRRGLSVTSWRMTPGLNLRESFRILKWAQRNEYDLLHSHGFKFNVLLGMYPERIRRIPMIATLHGYLRAPKFSKLWIYEILDRFSIRFMCGVVFVGEAMKSELSETFSSGNHQTVIPNGIDISLLKDSSQVPLDEPFTSFFENHEIVIIGVGRLSREKGFDRLISAFFEFREVFPEAGLIISGEGGLRSQLEALISQLHLKEHVLMPGYCGNVPGLLRQSTALVMPSLTEGLPITLLEAMSLKTPVIASCVGDIPIVLCDGECGELIKDVEPKTIFRTLERALSDKEGCKRKVNEAYRTVALNYSAEAMAVRYREFYDRVLVKI